MAEAFGVEQQAQTQGLNVNPNNRSVTRPGPGVDISGLDVAGVNKAIGNAADARQESGVVTSIQNARDKMRVMEATGKTPVEISRFRDEAASTILRRFPSKDAVNLVKTGLRETVAKRIRMRSDGSQYVEDADGNIQSNIDAPDSSTAIIEGITASGIDLDVNMPNYIKLGTTLLERASGVNDPNKVGVDVGAATVQSVALVSERMDRYRNTLKQLQHTLPTLNVENGNMASSIAGAGVREAFIQGMQTITSPEMMTIVGDKASGILPSEIKQLSLAYMNDVLGTMSDDNSFELLGIDPREFRADMMTIAQNAEQQATAAFNKDVTLAKRLATEAELLLSFYKSQVWIKLRETDPKAYSLAVTSEVVSDLAASLEIVRRVSANFSTDLGAAADLTESLVSIIGGGDATLALYAKSLSDHQLTTKAQVEKWSMMVTALIKSNTPTAMAAVRNDLIRRESGAGDELKVATGVLLDTGTKEEQEKFAALLAQYRAFAAAVIDAEEKTGTDLNTTIRTIGAAQDAANPGAGYKSIYDSIADFENLTEAAPRQDKSPTQDSKDVVVK